MSISSKPVFQNLIKKLEQREEIGKKKKERKS